jgi:hypothetical protein
VALVALSVVLGGCEQTQAESAVRPAQVEAIKGSDVSRVILTERAAGRIGLQTVPVQAVAGAAGSMPLAALVYDRDGNTWVYTVAGPLTYVRQRVAVARVSGETVVLQSGPAAGTAVVTVGASELLGSEYGVAGE